MRSGMIFSSSSVSVTTTHMYTKPPMQLTAPLPPYPLGRVVESNCDMYKILKGTPENVTLAICMTSARCFSAVVRKVGENEKTGARLSAIVFFKV